jgi:type IV secretory pathway VirB6-like protein
MGGGSTIAQFIWSGYAQTLAETASQMVNTILQAVVPWVQAALGLYVILAGKRMLTNATSFDREITTVVRAVLVCFLLTPANFNRYVTTAATGTIPDALAGALNGQSNMTGAEGFDALLNQISNFAAQIDSQATGIFYMAERITVWFAQSTASFMVMCCLFVWILAQAAIAFVVPIGAILIPFYLFDATREFTMRWFAKLVALFLVLVVSLMLGSFVVKLDAKYMQQFAKSVPAQTADPGFSMNAGDLAFTSFGEGLVDPAVGAALTQAQTQQQTANVAASINALWNAALVCAFGAFILAIMVGIALYIGGSSGFSAAPAANFIMTVATAGANRIIGRRRP